MSRFRSRLDKITPDVPAPSPLGLAELRAELKVLSDDELRARYDELSPAPGSMPSLKGLSTSELASLYHRVTS
ncbi:hypothetical protein [Rubrivirga sp.]|uniref:hypothetical protein n=1 Tax=Rubrivirga sp. TaxID=1885344 RepID=UPI003C76571F